MKGWDKMKLELKNVEKKFKDNIILTDINLKLESRKIYGLVGRNGSGKTVLLKMICGFYKPTSGEILLDGYNYIENNEFPCDTGALIEKPSFLPNLSGLENLLNLANIQKKVGTKEIEDILKVINLYEDRNKLYFKYSLGMKQKLGIAQAIMENQKIIILDEPFNGIETATANKLRDYLRKIKKDKIIIVATHIKDDLSNFIDEIYEVDNFTIKKISNK